MSMLDKIIIIKAQDSHGDFFSNVLDPDQDFDLKIDGNELKNDIRYFEAEDYPVSNTIIREPYKDTEDDADCSNGKMITNTPRTDPNDRNQDILIIAHKPLF